MAKRIDLAKCTARELGKLATRLGPDARDRVEANALAGLEQRFEQLCREMRDGIGLPELVGKLGSLPNYVNKPLRQLANASSWAGDKSLDPNFRHGSRTLLTRAERGGNGGQWDDVALAASKHTGWRKRLGERRARKELHGECRNWDMGDGWSLRTLNSCQELARVGRDYGNCLSGGRYGHYRRLKEGTSRFFELCHARPSEKRQGALLIQVNEEDEVEHTEGREADRAVTLKHLTELAGGRRRLQRLLLKVRGRIAPLGDDGLLADAGADPAFLGTLDVDEPAYVWRDGERKFRLWAARRLLVFRCKVRGEVHWSRFRFHYGRWDLDWGEMEEGELAALFASNRTVADIARRMGRRVRVRARARRPRCREASH